MQFRTLIRSWRGRSLATSIVFIALLFVGTLWLNADEPYARSRDYDLEHSRIALRFDVTEKKVIGDDYAYVHSSFTYLIDRNGRIRALMPYGHSPDDYAHDLAILLKE